MPRVTPRLGSQVIISPTWLTGVAQAFERIRRGEQVFVIINVPPQHGKTLLVTHGLVWLMLQLAGYRFAYCSYSEKRAWSMSRKTMPLLHRAGAYADLAQGSWRLDNGSSCIWTGIGGMLTGEPVDIGLIDDSTPNREAAESPVQREARWEWYTDVFRTRLQKNASAILVETRWHEDDMSGRLLRLPDDADPWEHVVHPALDDAGNALAPVLHPAERLLKMKAGMNVYSWASLYQQNPRPRGTSIFGPAQMYEPAALPTRHVRYGIGIDLAYTEKTRADYSVALVLARRGSGPAYVVDMLRKQVRAEDFVHDLTQLHARYPGASWRWHTSTTEKGTAGLLRRLGVPVVHIPAVADKFTRSLEVSGAHNQGQVLWPAWQPWTQEALDEVTRFTGGGDAHDDVVDALASAYAAVKAGSGPLTGKASY